jgi:hypothetical protein
MAPGLSMSRGIFSFRRGAVMVILLAAALLWPQRAGGSDWFEGKNYRDRHYENDLYRAGVAVDTGSLIKAVQGDAREDVRRWAAIVLGRRHTAAGASGVAPSRGSPAGPGGLLAGG